MRRPPRHHRHRSDRFPVRAMRRRDPSIWNTMLFHLRSIPIHLTYLRFAMHTSKSPNSRRNTLIRTAATICGDIATGAAIASACVWIIESAMLGLFLSFLVWLVGILLALAVSQFVVHPAAAVLLSDRKLDQAVDALAGLTGVVSQVGSDLGSSLMSSLRSSSVLRHFRPA